MVSGIRIFHPSRAYPLVVSDSLEYSPEKCTVVASYNKLVVGVAIMSSPRETYITYLAVRHGWDTSNIATSVYSFQQNACAYDPSEQCFITS